MACSDGKRPPFVGACLRTLRQRADGSAPAQSRISSLSNLRKGVMKIKLNSQRGAAGWILLWLVGVPIPVLLLLFLVRGCT
jgi:hypothetical protein